MSIGDSSQSLELATADKVGAIATELYMLAVDWLFGEAGRTMIAGCRVLGDPVGE